MTLFYIFPPYSSPRCSLPLFPLCIITFFLSHYPLCLSFCYSLLHFRCIPLFLPILSSSYLSFSNHFVKIIPSIFIAKGETVMYVPNHTSFVDILVLSGFVPRPFKYLSKVLYSLFLTIYEIYSFSTLTSVFILTVIVYSHEFFVYHDNIPSLLHSILW